MCRSVLPIVGETREEALRAMACGEGLLGACSCSAAGAAGASQPAQPTPVLARLLRRQARHRVQLGQIRCGRQHRPASSLRRHQARGVPGGRAGDGAGRRGGGHPGRQLLCHQGPAVAQAVSGVPWDEGRIQGTGFVMQPAHVAAGAHPECRSRARLPATLLSPYAPVPSLPCWTHRQGHGVYCGIVGPAVHGPGDHPVAGGPRVLSVVVGLTRSCPHSIAAQASSEEPIRVSSLQPCLFVKGGAGATGCSTNPPCLPASLALPSPQQPRPPSPRPCRPPAKRITPLCRSSTAGS